MDGPQFVDDVERVEACIIGDDSGDDFEGFGEHVHDQLFLACDADSVLLEAPGEFHLSCAPARDDGVGLEAASDDHDGIVERAFSLLDELLGAAAEDDGCRFGLSGGRGTLGQSSKRL